MEIALWSVLGAVVVGVMGVLYFEAKYNREDAAFWRGLYKAEVEYQEELGDANYHCG